MSETPLRRRCDEAEACIIVPVFNHGSTVGDVVRGALQHASTVLVCDDGRLYAGPVDKNVLIADAAARK